MTNDLKKEIDKIKYHIRLLGEAIDYNKHPVTSLVIDMNWSNDDLNKIHDIFEHYDNMLNEGKAIIWREFEMELRNNFKISYQTVKMIVLAFHFNHQWKQVCYNYAMSFEPDTPIEFHPITRKEADY